MLDRINKPIFVVGSPRSGTTILAYCLCQHFEAAQLLSAEIDSSPQPTGSSPAAADELENVFRKRIEYVAALDNAYRTTTSRLESTIAELRRQIEDFLISS